MEKVWVVIKHDEIVDIFEDVDEADKLAQEITEDDIVEVRPFYSAPVVTELD